IVHVTSERYAGKPLRQAFPHLRSLPDLCCRPLGDKEGLDRVDVAFCALPHLASMREVPQLLGNALRVIDLSADFRLHDPLVYRSWYGSEHLATQLLPEAVYGLPELHRAAITTARLVANPGCYPTSVLLALAPLLKGEWIDPACLLIDSKSGVSGAGRSASQDNLFTEVEGGFRAYKVEGHRHTPEMEQELSLLAGTELRIRFVPHLLPQSRGILSTCHLRPRVVRSQAEWQETLHSYYLNEPFVQVLEAGNWPATSHVRGSNYCHLGVAVDSRTGWLTVLSVIDNLVKGAAGQAVQNMNLMFGMDERTGLEQLPLFP
ncbi:N-acetyl-gamma-glutamyl-phosphate reductase, partial [Candidatus Magnetaquicoccus inordinatus]|uniref:N-acetyl-gamma-glutamyl-phosphate reductase n=1 Tax=Candidatus Magnetaquicoccus inordinatus TaxID=2496818 RepID=UPI00102BCE22